jgi:hypothetical protein
MGVPLVCYHVEAQPHTPSSHFAGFPTWTPRSSLYASVLFYLHIRRIMNPPFHPSSVGPSANLSSSHLPHTETRQWGPHPSPVFPEISALPGEFIPHWGTRFCILYIFPTFIHYFLYKHLLLPSFAFSSPLATYFPFWPHATHITLGWSITSHFPLTASSISSEYYPSHLPLSSEFVHLVPPLAQLILDPVIPMTLDLVNTVAATPYIMHPPTKGSLESSHYLTSSMYLCHPLTAVDSMKPSASRSHVLLLSTSTHFSKRATVS